ncbi:unnamed protein product [Caenorhabditis bovis]|uniref:Nucleosome assembly protein n=1 Tax=Caenorhabditis bovis TaxID=2654633 RepID=A0A8S1F3W1_9PELO|nr:unnamed protein product [Caenorhabditis bovis]
MTLQSISAEMVEQMGQNLQGNHDVLGPLPKAVKKRVCALKSLQLKTIDIEAKFYERVQALEIEFEQLFKPLMEERRKIVTGEREPTDEEASEKLLYEADDAEIEDLYKNSLPDTDKKGIPDFWLNALRSHDMISETIQEHDVPILSFLTDITTTASLDPPSFTLEFHFAENQFFSNKVIKKTYDLEIIPTNNEEKYRYEGPSVVRAYADKIDWLDGKDVTKKVVKKKQKKGAAAGKFLTKTIKADSFFNFFDPPTAPTDKNEDEELDEESLQSDYELGQTIRDSIIPRAVLFYTGELLTDEMFDYGEDDEEYSGDEDEDN